MKNFEVSLEENVAERIEEAAERLGLSPEDFLRLSAEEKLAPLPYEQVRAQVSHGGHALVRLSFGTLPPPEHEVMWMRLLDIYRQQLAKHTCLFDNGEEMLGELDAGKRACPQSFGQLRKRLVMQFGHGRTGGKA